MAKSISIKSGSPLIGSPICVAVTSDTVGNACAFHDVNLVIHAALSTDYVYETFRLSAPAENAEEVVFDVSSCLRSLASKYNYKPASQQVPHLRFQLSAYDSYMRNGIYYDQQNVVNYGQELTALFGAFSERERLSLGEFAEIGRFTRKPKTGEVFGTRLGYIYAIDKEEPISLSSQHPSGPVSSYYTATLVSGMKEIEGRKVYFDPNKKDLVYFLFVNSRGAIESVCAETMESMGSTGSTETNARSYLPSFASTGSISSIKSERRAEITCSTGPINQEWAKWWMDEFLGGDKFRDSLSNTCWVNLDGKWIPCVACADDELEIYDRSQPNVLQIQFTVRLGVTGHQ